MGAGQIGGIATLLDMDFKNPAGFLGEIAPINDAQYLVHFLSHSMLFCLGAIIEAHVIITPAICVVGERYKFAVYGGTNKFLENAGIERQISHICIHRGYNKTNHWSECTPNMQLALMMTHKPFSFHDREPGADFVINRIRYGHLPGLQYPSYIQCAYHGFGSRRNGYLIPLLIDLRRHVVTVHSPVYCAKKWNYVDAYLCMDTPPCLSEKYGALCPDDVGSVIVCDGVAKGMMISRLVDRPCGSGFVDLERYRKFITCGVDDSREVIHHDEFLMYDFTPPATPEVITPFAPTEDISEEIKTDTAEAVPEPEEEKAEVKVEEKTEVKEEKEEKKDKVVAEEKNDKKEEDTDDDEVRK
ncbi:uncharacterized protein LOC128676988 [Plodia interpunctella]|uniref:uncharacterized protein LOC128676988 n=1 Tax=Plodia interpunctella TaxID=58824 RepID=UPI00236770B5|nr:uncharacterized protein LOC128676988 [Plodia interpunctella]